MSKFKYDLDRELKIPLHHQIYCIIKEEIEKGVFKEGDMIYPESQMQEMFGVSRITVRKAVEELAHDSYVEKKQGKGTTVLPQKNKYCLTNLTSFTDDVQSSGKITGSILLDFMEIPADAKVAENLQIPYKQPVYLLKRLRMMENEIVGLHEAYIVKSENIQLSRDMFKKNTSLYDLLENMGVKIDYALELIEAKVPSVDLCKILDIDPSIAVFYKERITHDDKGIPFEYVEIFYRADKFKYYVKMDKAKQQ
jgi:GntR family transcriptional regulator